MKDKIERTPFDETAFHDKVHEHYLGYRGELQICTDKKSELFIQVNYFHSVLDDAMEFLLKTDQARGLKPHQIIRILFEKEILDDVEAKNANKITKIRNLFAHPSDSPHMLRNVAEIINKIEIESMDSPPMTGHTTASTKEIVENPVAKWDMYQKLDFLIHDLTMNVENKVISKK
jgi:hypothetical protein